MMADASYHLRQPTGMRMMEWLTEKRGLTVETIKSAGLGFLPLDRWDVAPAWGLEEILKENGTPKKLWFPRGIVIPLCHGSQVLRLRIRRPKSAGDPRYYLVRGSDTRAMVLGNDKAVTVVVESELDAILLHQEAADLVNVVALGNAQSRPDVEAADLLKRSCLILLSLDADNAGGKESWQWWRAHYLQARRWPPVAAKDPADMVMAGINLKSWVEAGLAEYAEDRTFQPGSVSDPAPTPKIDPGPPPLDLPAGVCFFQNPCGGARYRKGALFCVEAGQIVLSLADCPLGWWHKTADGFPLEADH